MHFDALDVSLKLIRALRPIVKKIKMQDPKEAEQMTSAASSVCRSLSEGRMRVGRDRPHLFRIASGSASEVRTGLLIAQAWGWVTQDEVAEAEALSDRLAAMMWRLTH